MTEKEIELAVQFYSKLDLLADQSEWSQRTFGTDDKRGPIGALRHLSKEAIEAADRPGDIVEYADCLLLLLEAIRRADFTLNEVVDAAKDKMCVNRSRTWPTPTSDEPVEHVRQSTRHPSVEHVLRFFSYFHLPGVLHGVARPFYELAFEVANRAPHNPETTVALRKLLEAKDAAVRAAL